MIPTQEAVLPQVGNIDDPWGSWMMWLKHAETDWTPLWFSVKATASLPSSRKGDGRSLPGLLSPESQMYSKIKHFWVLRRQHNSLQVPTYPKPPSDLTACNRNQTRKPATTQKPAVSTATKPGTTTTKQKVCWKGRHPHQNFEQEWTAA